MATCVGTIYEKEGNTQIFPGLFDTALELTLIPWEPNALVTSLLEQGNVGVRK